MQIPTVNCEPRVLGASEQLGASVAASAAARTAGVAAPELACDGALGASRAPFYKAMPCLPSFCLRADEVAPATRGYALTNCELTDPRATSASLPAKPAQSGNGAARATAGASQAAATEKASTASAASKKATAKKSELAFLSDKNLSIQEKLFQFMALMTKKNDKELEDAMKDYEQKKAEAAKDGGGGFFGVIGDLFGGIASAFGPVGDLILSGAESLLDELGGPLLAGVATALGMPALAPTALQLGDKLGEGLSSALSSSRAAASSSSSKAASSSSSTKDSGEFDEKLEMLKLQRMVEKQNTMYAAITNVLKSIHDSQMMAVQNIR
jgi:hypothetical protein